MTITQALILWVFLKKNFFHWKYEMCAKASSKIPGCNFFKNKHCRHLYATNKWSTPTTSFYNHNFQRMAHLWFLRDSQMNFWNVWFYYFFSLVKSTSLIGVFFALLRKTQNLYCVCLNTGYDNYFNFAENLTVSIVVIVGLLFHSNIIIGIMGTKVSNECFSKWTK